MPAVHNDNVDVELTKIICTNSHFYICTAIYIYFSYITYKFSDLFVDRSCSAVVSYISNIWGECNCESVIVWVCKIFSKLSWCQCTVVLKIKEVGEGKVSPPIQS